MQHAIFIVDKHTIRDVCYLHTQFACLDLISPMSSRNSMSIISDWKFKSINVRGLINWTFHDTPPHMVRRWSAMRYNHCLWSGAVKHMLGIMFASISKYSNEWTRGLNERRFLEGILATCVPERKHVNTSKVTFVVSSILYSEMY